MTDAIIDRLTAALADRYRIERPLGEGGMAMVYQADDLKHERQVAIKVLKPELAAVIGGERFVAEIKTTAALQHPHILPLFDSGEADGFLYYVMPYIEGESLREKLDREKQLPVDEAVRIAEAVASALQYAHERGIVHRDIKPANILLHAGQPVVADFGIALAVSAAGGGRLTETGMSVGTPYYMSPEQATADRDVTARSDIYSLSCVLYEMLAGDPPHAGSNAQAVLMRILTEDARPVTDVRKSVPPNVGSAVEKGLEKLPADRFADAAEFARALGDSAFRHRQRDLSGTPAASRGEDSGTGSGRWKLVALAAIPALAIGAMLGRGWNSRGGESAIDGNAPVIRMAFDSAMGIQYAGLVDISNDGSTLAYTGPDGVRIVELDGPRQRTLPGTEEAEFVVFSHDGSELAVFDNRSLYRVPVAGGPPIPLLERPVSLPVEWAADGTLYFLGLDALYRLPPEGEPERIADVGLLEASTVTELPGGRWLLYSRRASAGSDPDELRILDLESMESRTLLLGGFSPRYAATGHVVYARDDQSVFAVEFDAEAGEVVGRPFAVLDSLALASPGLAPMALSETGSFFYVRGPRIGERWHQARFARVSEDGTLDVLPIPEAELGAPHLSPDGEHLAFTRGQEIVVHDLRTGGETTLSAGLVGDLSWSDDGERIAYQGLGGEGGGSFFGIWRWREGATAREVDVDRAGFFSELDFTPDGRLIGHLRETGAGTQSDILIADTAGAITPYLNATWSERHPRISPDGEWVAYDSDESGASEVYLRAYPTPGERYDISAGPGRLPLWTPEGDLYFVRGDSLWLAELSLDPEPTVRSRRPVLSREQAAGRINLGSVTAGPGGEIIAQIFPRDDEEADAEPEPGRPRVAWIVANWFTELLERAGGN